MKNIYLLGISVAVGLAVLYLVWQQRKRLDNLITITHSIQPVPIGNSIDKEFFIQETQQLHRKIEASYERIHQQYQEVIGAIDNLPIFGCMDYSGEDGNSENIRSYHGENLIDIDEPQETLELSLDEPLPQSVLGIAENTQLNESTKSSRKSTTITDKVSANKMSCHKNNSEPMAELPTHFNDNSVEHSTMSFSVSAKGPKVAELKNLCKQYGLSNQGNKKDLMERLKKVGHSF